MVTRRSPGYLPVLTGASLLLSAAAAAQAPAPPAGAPAFRESTEVTVVNFEVVVTDARGVTVRGLAAEDFEIRRGGEPVPILNFYAVEAGNFAGPAPVGAAEPAPAGDVEPAKASPPPRSLIFFLDQTNLSPASRKRTSRELRTFLEGLSVRGARIALVTWDRSMKVRIPLGDRVDATGDAIEAIVQEAPKGDRFDLELLRLKQEMDQSDAEPQPLQMQIRSYSERRSLQVRDSVAALRAVIDSAAGLPGAKSVVYIGDGLPLRPGEPLAELWANRFQLDWRTGRVTTAAQNDVVRGLDELVAAANRSRVTFYPLYADLPSASSRGSAATTSGSPYVAPGLGDAVLGPPVVGAYDTSFAAQVDETNQEPLRELATGTGGRVALSPNGWTEVLAGWSADLADHYSLGFAPAGDGRAAQKIEVRVKREGLVVRHRRSVAELGLEERLHARTAAALLFGGVDNPLGIGVQLQPELPGKGAFTVPIRVSVPIGGLLLVPEGDTLAGRVTLLAAARDAAGNRSEDVRYVCPLRIPAAELEVARTRSMVCGTAIRMAEGAQTLAVTARDDASLEESTVVAAVTLPSGAATAR